MRCLRENNTRSILSAVRIRDILQSADLVKLFLTDHNCAIPSGCMFPKLNMMMGKVYLSKEIYNESNI